VIVEKNNLTSIPVTISILRDISRRMYLSLGKPCVESFAVRLPHLLPILAS
jgi:hypothetical protein